MGIINICFQLNGFSDETLSSQNLSYKQIGASNDLEHDYQAYYKPIAAFLYSHPNLNFSFSFSSYQIEWFAKNHKEFCLLLSELAGRKQIELLGGTLYNPLLPAILPVDRVGQIEDYTILLRQYTGKRPRGMILPNYAWDTSLITSLKTCGMEYIVVDSNMIPSNRTRFLPYIVQGYGKNIFVLGENQDLIPNPSTSAEEYLAFLADNVKNTCPAVERPLMLCSITPEHFCKLINSGWFTSFLSSVEEQISGYSFESNTPVKYLKTAQHYQRAYLPTGLHSRKTGLFYNIYDYLLRDSATYLLYSKMMYVSMQVSQSRGDKSRKNMATELVWQAQIGQAYSGLQDLDGDNYRLAAYKSLIQAERSVREYMDFFESVTSFDYDSDGIHEYICQFNQFNAYIQARGGSVFELDVMKTAHNYAGCTAGRTGLFLDYLYDASRSYRGDTFSRQIYREVGFDGKRHEIKLIANGSVGELNQPVVLRKNYLVNSSGIQVQYILKNESPFPLRQCFSVQSNFFVSAAGTEDLNAEVISGEQKELKVFSGSLVDKSCKDVSLVRISDNEVTFVFEMNENADISFCDEKGCLEVLISWNVDIPAEREIEKTISFSVISKSSRNRKKL